MDGIISSAFILPGKRGSIAKCSMQLTSILHKKPSEVIAVYNSNQKLEHDLLNKVKYIGKLKVDPTLRKTEIITSVHKFVHNETVMFFDGDGHIGPASLIKLFDAYTSNPNAVYCSSLKDIGDIEGFVCGSSFSEDGSSIPNVKEYLEEDISKIECLHLGCILFPKNILKEISSVGPCSCVEEMSRRISAAGYPMYCVNRSSISYKGLINLEVKQ